MTALILALQLAAAPCPIDVSGDVPGHIPAALCDVAAAVDAGPGPINRLTVVLDDPEFAEGVRLGSANMDDMLLMLLEHWQMVRGRAARVEVFFGRVRLATVKPRPWRGGARIDR